MEAAAGMLIHSTALRPIDMAQCASPLCVVSVGAVRPLSGRHCQGVSVESLVPYTLVVPGLANRFTRSHAFSHCYRASANAEEKV